MIKKIFIILGTVLSIALIGLYFSYDYWLEKELKYQLSEIISKDPNSLYEYSFEKLDIDLIDGSVDLKGIRVEPRERAYDSLSSDSGGVRFLLKLELEEIELLQFDIREFINTNKIVVESINIIQPKFSYYFHPHKGKGAQNMPVSEIFSDQFKSANIKNFTIQDGQLEIDNYLSPDPALLINYLDIELTDAFIDSATLKRITPIDYETISLRADSISLGISDYFSMVSDSLRFDASEEAFLIYDFKIKPKFTQENFAKQFDVQKQWFALTLESLSIRQIDLERFIDTGEISVGRVRIRRPNIALYKDKSKPEPPFHKKPLPVTAIQSIPFKINVDSVQIINGYIAVEETSPLTGLNSHVSFHTLNGLLTNFTNLPQASRHSDIMKLSASTLMYNSAPISLNMQFDLNSSLDEFTARGEAGQVDLITFNQVLEPMMAVKVTGGQLHKMTFSFSAMDTLSTGILDMNYSNAKLEVISKDTADQKNKKGLLSFAANTLIKTNNDQAKSGYVRGVISTSRVQNKDVWPFLWHSVQSGIISTMAPITNDKEAKQIQKKKRQQLKEVRKENKD